MKRVLIGVVMAMFAVSAHASYLWWQVDSSDFEGGLNTADEVIGANIYYSNATDPVYGEGTKLDSARVDFGVERKIDLSSLGDLTGYSFYIELIGYDSKVYGDEKGVVGNSEWQTYTALSEAGYIVDTLNIPSIPVWHGSAYAAPEPTSGLLMIMGLALLSLKRRKE